MRYCLGLSSPKAITVTNTTIPVITVDLWCGEDDLEPSLLFMKIRAVIFRVLIWVQIQCFLNASSSKQITVRGANNQRQPALPYEAANYKDWVHIERKAIMMPAEHRQSHCSFQKTELTPGQAELRLFCIWCREAETWGQGTVVGSDPYSGRISQCPTRILDHRDSLLSIFLFPAYGSEWILINVREWWQIFHGLKQDRFLN